jgi:transposase
VKRKVFQESLEAIKPEQIVYVDECGLEESICREYGRSKVGTLVQADITGKRTERTSLIAGLNQGKAFAPFYFTGYCNTEVVSLWVKEVLTPELKPGQTVIWDNATFHHANEVQVLIEAAGCRLLFLPPYSPDLNPIEHYWAKLKSWIKRVRLGERGIPEALHEFFKTAQ